MNSKNFIFRLSPEQLKKLAEIAKKQSRTMAGTIRHWIDKEANK
jgi:predicted DNA-binding protein